MIKVGDKFTYKEHEWTVIDLDNFQDTLEAKDEDGNERYFMQSKAYKNWYEQQKQRADLLEKRWKNLKEHFVKEKEKSFGMLSWSRNNGMLELIERLQEDK